MSKSRSRRAEAESTLTTRQRKDGGRSHPTRLAEFGVKPIATEVLERNGKGVEAGRYLG